MDNGLNKAADAALASVIKIRDNRDKEFELVENRILSCSFDKETSTKIRNIIIPQKENIDKPAIAFGIFLGHTLGIQSDAATCTNKMNSDIRACMEHMKQQIQILNLVTYSFYAHVVQFNNTLLDKK